ncbi:hypothetical protein Tco_0077079, partial [Tanacetum coccineum]
MLCLAAYVPAGSRNPPASVSAGSAFPAGSRNRPASVSAGWRNHAARPMTRPTSHYFQHFRRPGCYNQLYMDEGRWGTAVKTSAGCSWKIKRPYMQWENPHKNKDLGIVDSGYSRSMTGNKEKLDDFVADLLTKAFDGPRFNYLCGLQVLFESLKLDMVLWFGLINNNGISGVGDYFHFPM